MYPVMMRRPIWAISFSSAFPGLPGVLCQAFNLSSRFITPSKICTTAKMTINRRSSKIGQTCCHAYSIHDDQSHSVRDTGGIKISTISFIVSHSKEGASCSLNKPQGKPQKHAQHVAAVEAGLMTADRDEIELWEKINKNQKCSETKHAHAKRVRALKKKKKVVLKKSLLV